MDRNPLRNCPLRNPHLRQPHLPPGTSSGGTTSGGVSGVLRQHGFSSAEPAEEFADSIQVCIIWVTMTDDDRLSSLFIFFVPP